MPRQCSGSSWEVRNLNNQIYDAFDKIHAEHGLKERTKQYLAQKSGRRQYGPLRYAAVFALAALCILLGGGGYTFYMAPVAAISIDINPSMEWELNRFDRVVSVTCYNEDARNVVSDLPLKYKKYDDAITLLLTSREMSPYLARDPEVNISVVSENAGKEQEIQNRAAECAGQHCGSVSCHGGSMEERQAAQEAGVSLGKYQAFQILKEYYPDITLEETGGMCMHEIQDMIAQSQASDEGQDSGITDPDESDSGAADTSGFGCGNGNGNANGCHNGGGHGHHHGHGHQ